MLCVVLFSLLWLPKYCTNGSRYVVVSDMSHTCKYSFVVFSIYMLVLVKFLFWVISDCIILFTNKNIFRIYITKMRLVWCRWNQKPFKRINVQEKLDDLGRLCFLYLYTNLHQECALLLIFPLSRIMNICLFDNTFHMFNICDVYINITVFIFTVTGYFSVIN